MSKSQRMLLLAFMSLVLMLLNADANVLNPNLTLIEKEFGINDGNIGLIMGLFSIVGAVVSLVWGYLTDKTGRKKLFAWSVLIGTVPCMGTAFAPNYEWFFVLRVLTGIGVGASFPVVFSIIGDLYNEKERPFATALLTTAISLGNIFGIVLGGYTTGIHAGTLTGWRLPFLLASAPNVPLALLFLLVVPEVKRGASEDATKTLIEQGLVYPKTIKFSDYRKLFTVKTNLFLFIQGIMGTIPWGATAFINKLLEDNKGLSKPLATTVFMIFGVGMVLGTILGGKFGELLFKRSPKYLPRFCAVTTAIGACMAVATFMFMPNNFFLLSLTGFLTAFMVAMTGPNMRTMLLDTNVPENRGAIFSIFNLTDSVGMGFGKFIAGVLSVQIGLTLSLSTCSLFWFGCAIVLWFAAAVFVPDIKILHRKMEDVAGAMTERKD